MVKSLPSSHISQPTMSDLKKDSGLYGPQDERIIDPRTEQEVEEEKDAHVGVKTVEAAEKVYGRYSKWLLYLGCV